MRVRAFLAADQAAITSEGGKLVIEGIFDTILSENYPSQHKSLTTVLIFDDKKNNFKYELFVRHGDNRIKIAATDFTKENETHRVISKIDSWIIEEEGEYVFEADLNNKTVATYPIIVKKL